MRQSVVAVSLAASGVMGIALLAGCSGSGYSVRNVDAKAGARVADGDPAMGAASLERIKKLEGDWDLVSEDGTRSPGLVIRVTAAGSSVREIMFPGSGHEMTNMYHADGGTIMMTHYCAAGNQPRMRAVASGDGQPIAFSLDSVTNLGGRDDTYMGSMSLNFVDANTIRQDWNHFSLNKGKSDGVTSLTFKRQGT